MRVVKVLGFRARWPAIRLLAPMALCLLCSFSNAAAPVNENELKVAYLFNFAKFVKWPNELVSNDFGVCALNPGDISSAFLALNGRLLGVQKMKVTFLKSIDNVDWSGCQILYLDGEGAAESKHINLQLREKPVLIVADAPIHQSGAMISLFNVKNKLRFEVNIRTIEENKLIVSSHLSKLAIKVYE